jgi:phosphatidylglycerol---prolipoprotein diacylglyceryl transferase
MYPILAEFGPLTIYSLWIFIALGFFAALLVINKLAHKNRLSILFIAEHSLVIFFGGLFMARLVYVIQYFNAYFSELSVNSFFQLFYIWDKGLSPWGGIVGVLLVLAFFAHKNDEETAKWMDVFAVAILSAIAVSCIGAFLDGRNYGRETSLPWGVLIESSIYAVPIHPTQIYAALYTGILSIALYIQVSKRQLDYPGQAAIFALLGYSVLRFIEEFFRGDESNIFFGLREAQFYTIAGIIISLTLLKILNNNKNDHGNI